MAYCRTISVTEKQEIKGLLKKKKNYPRPKSQMCTSIWVHSVIAAAPRENPNDTGLSLTMKFSVARTRIQQVFFHWGAPPVSSPFSKGTRIVLKTLCKWYEGIQCSPFLQLANHLTVKSSMELSVSSVLPLCGSVASDAILHIASTLQTPFDFSGFRKVQSCLGCRCKSLGYAHVFIVLLSKQNLLFQCAWNNVI